MRKPLFLLLATAGMALSQSCPTGFSKIAQTLTSGTASAGGQPNLWAGTITIRSNNNSPVGSSRSVGTEVDTSVIAGAFAYCLVPGNYIVTYRPTKDTGRQTNAIVQSWVIADANQTYSVTQVETAQPQTPNLTVLLSQLAGAPASGTYCVQSVDGVINWASCGGGGGSAAWGTITGTLSSQTDLSTALAGKLGTSGNAVTATALAANGTNCAAGSPALGVDAGGNAEGCAPVVTSINGSSGAINTGGTVSYSADHTLQQSDCNNMLVVNGSSLTITLATLTPPCRIPILNLNASSLSVARNSLTVNGATSGAWSSMTQFQSVTFSLAPDNTNWVAQGP